MGFFDFVKDAGEKVFGKGDDKKAAPPEVQQPTPEDLKRYHDRRKGALLVESVQKMGLKVEDLSVRVDGEAAHVAGKVPTEIDKEKLILVVGNTAGIGRVHDDQLVVEQKAVFYTVQPGDSLSKIAKQHYGDPMKYPVIFEANKPMLEDPDKIYPGQSLRIPPLDG